jgi:hypothetical protein
MDMSGIDVRVAVRLRLGLPLSELVPPSCPLYTRAKRSAFAHAIWPQTQPSAAEVQISDPTLGSESGGEQETKDGAPTLQQRDHSPDEQH